MRSMATMSCTENRWEEAAVADAADRTAANANNRGLVMACSE